MDTSVSEDDKNGEAMTPAPLPTFHPKTWLRWCYEAHKRECWNCSCDVEIVADLCPEGRNRWSMWYRGKRWV